MLHFLYGHQLAARPALAHGMFRDRAIQFHDRQGWAVTVDARGEERDAYDDENPLYVIWAGPEGRHGGSMRLLPTLGRTMLNDHFAHVAGGRVEDPAIWECTRFCLAPGADGRVAAALMLGGGAVMRGFGLRHLAGVFDAPMVRIYRAIGASPEILGSQGAGRTRVSAGLWSLTEPAQARVARRAGLPLAQVQDWFETAMRATPAASAPAIAAAPSRAGVSGGA
ncbi:MAG: acyl-homoserine-lactone synthase [Paracoccaceae bacterium]